MSSLQIPPFGLRLRHYALGILDNRSPRSKWNEWYLQDIMRPSFGLRQCIIVGLALAALGALCVGVLAQLRTPHFLAFSLLCVSPLVLPAILILRPSRLRHASSVKLGLVEGDETNPLCLRSWEGTALVVPMLASFFLTITIGMVSVI